MTGYLENTNENEWNDNIFLEILHVHVISTFSFINLKFRLIARNMKTREYSKEILNVIVRVFGRPIGHLTFVPWSCEEKWLWELISFWETITISIRKLYFHPIVLNILRKRNMIFISWKSTFSLKMINSVSSIFPNRIIWLYDLKWSKIDIPGKFAFFNK